MSSKNSNTANFLATADQKMKDLYANFRQQVNKQCAWSGQTYWRKLSGRSEISPAEMEMVKKIFNSIKSELDH